VTLRARGQCPRLRPARRRQDSRGLGALGHALVEAGQSVLFSPTFQSCRSYSLPNATLDLPRALAPTRFVRRRHPRRHRLRPAVAGTNRGPLHLPRERYERRSVVITSNLVFSEWDRIFKNPMTYGGSHRPTRSPLGHLGVHRSQLPLRQGQTDKATGTDRSTKAKAK